MSEHWRVESTPTRVEGWCAERLKFEHRSEWMNRFRAELRNRLCALNGSDGLLHGVYTSSLRDFADAENVLFYNVGEGTFKHLTQKGMRFERSFHSAGGTYPHHHSYQLTESPSFAHWEPAHELVSFVDVRCRHGPNSSTPGWRCTGQPLCKCAAHWRQGKRSDCR